MCIALCVCLVSCASVQAQTAEISGSGADSFRGHRAEAGVHFVTHNFPTPNKNQPETMVAGIALFDYDNDGYLDIYFVNGAAIPSLKKNRPSTGTGSSTTTTTEPSPMSPRKAGVAGKGYGMGAAVGDYDNDGWPDLYVANVNGNQLFHNNADGTFTDVTGKAGVAGAELDGRKMWSAAPAGSTTTTTAARPVRVELLQVGR